MGSGFSKSEKNLLNLSQQDSVQKIENPLTLELSLDSSLNVDGQDNLDPRSPTAAICRTPINEFLNRKSVTSSDSEQFGISPSTVAALKDYADPKKLIKTKIIKEINSKLIDPRSPNQFINRTPIVFGENDDSSCTVDIGSDGEKSFNLNDTFSDLFVTTNSEGIASSSSPKVEGQNKDLPIPLTPVELDQSQITTSFQRDPRSPLYESDRTPIVFSDDENDNNDDNDGRFESVDENDMIENLIENVYKNDSGNKWFTNDKTPKNRFKKKYEKIVYEDDDNDDDKKRKESSTVFKRAVTTNPAEQVEKLKRTPLSCMRNISHLKSKKTNIAGVKMLNGNFKSLNILKYCTVEEKVGEENRIQTDF